MYFNVLREWISLSDFFHLLLWLPMAKLKKKNYSIYVKKMSYKKLLNWKNIGISAKFCKFNASFQIYLKLNKIFQNHSMFKGQTFLLNFFHFLKYEQRKKLKR